MTARAMAQPYVQKASTTGAEMTGLSDIDPTFTPTRLQICAYLSGCVEADYAAVQHYCKLTKPTLSKSLTLLDELDYVQIRKAANGRYTKTVLALTDTGRAALGAHLDALRQIADAAAAAGSGAARP